MNAKYPIKAFDGTSFSDVQVLNVPAGAIGANGEIDLGQGIKVYRALLTQTGTDAPIASVLENTLGGTVVWTRDSAGVYVATLTGAFTADKTIAPGRVWFTSSTDVITCAGVRTSANAITYTVNKWHWEDLATNVMEVQDISELGLPATVLLDVEILVYP